MASFIIYMLFIKIIQISSSCIQGFNHCLKCDPTTNLCYKCEKNIYSPDEKGGCKYAQICEEGNNNCIECEKDRNLCKICEKSYFPNENGQCSYTKNCELSEKGKCLKCEDNFILIGKDSEYSIKICKSLNSEDLKNSEIINIQNGFCEKCKERFYLNEGDKKCTTVENCYNPLLEFVKNVINIIIKINFTLL